MLSDRDGPAVSHAYGPATDLPDVLWALRSEEEQHRAEAVWRFRAKVLHQGSLYPAGAAAAPFLIELLADADAPDRTLGHELLAGLMTAEAMGWLDRPRPHRRGPWWCRCPPCRASPPCWSTGWRPAART
ncbi:hypothetical protein ACQP2X_06785 [Actinoplanes sp. CA-131856]